MSDYLIVSRSYPSRYWAEHGAEIIATANELNGHRWSFRESRQLAANGLRTRSFEATGGELRHVWAQGLAIWLVIILLNMNRGWVVQLLGHDGVAALGPTWESVALLIALMATAFSTRWPAMLLIAGALLPSFLDADAGPPWIGVIFVAIMTISVAVFGDGRRVVSPTVLGFLFAAVVASTSLWFVSPLLIGPILLICGLAIVRFDVRILAAATIHAIAIASMLTVEVLFPGPNSRGSLVNESSTDLTIGAVTLTVVAGVLGTLVMWRTRLVSRHL